MVSSHYNRFLSLTPNIHAGDYAPQTQAGRSIFVVWALVGVVSVTILISSMAVDTTLTVSLS